MPFNTYRSLMNAVVGNPNNQLQQMILVDYLEESHYPILSKVIRNHGIYWNFVGSGVGGDGSGDGGGYGSGDGSGDGSGGVGDGSGDGGGYGSGDGSGGVGDGSGDGGGCGSGDGGSGDGGGYGSGDGGGGVGGYGSGGVGGVCSRSKIPEGFNVDDGLYILCMPGGWYPWVLVGWVERDDLFIKFKNCRVIRRYGSSAQLSVIAKKGPQSDTELLKPSELELIPITSISRAILCDEVAWKTYCPRPS